MMYEIFLEIANKDLDAAKCLYDNELYPQAIFYLQQSVEKAAKSFAIMTSMIKENEVRPKIGHNPLEIHKKLLKEQRKKLEELNMVFEEIPRLKEIALFKAVDFSKQHRDSDKLQKFINAVIKKKPGLLSEQEILQFTKSLNEFESETKEIGENIPSFSIPKEEFSKIKESFMELFDIIQVYNPQEAEKAKKEFNTLDRSVFEEALKIMIPILLDFAYVHLSLFYLSIITFPHAVIARYPDSDFNPIEFYNKDLPLIELFDKCVGIMMNVLAKIEHLKCLQEKNL